MPPWLQITIAWFRRQFAWSNSRRSWQERLGTLTLVGTLVGGWYFSSGWDLGVRLLLLCAWLTLLAILLRRGLIKLVGPVFFFEVLRGSRKRIHLFRTLYGLLLIFAICWVWIAYGDVRHDSRQLQEQAQFAQTIFLVFFCVQMLVIFFLTPVVVASAIAEEKERRTLEFVLATDLRSREVLFGKLAGRMANMSLYLVAGFPILAILQLMGGIDPELLLASIAGAVATFFGLSALSILMSVLQRRSREAIVLTFLAIVAYYVLSISLYAVLEIPGVKSWTLVAFGSTVTSHDIINFINSGNVMIQILDVVKAIGFVGGSFHDILYDILRNYLLFHAVLIAVCLTWAAIRLRPVAMMQMQGGEARKARTGRRHPAIGRWPMMWKEVFADAPRMHWVQKIILALIVIVSFVAPVWITVEYAPKLFATPPTWSVGATRWERWNDPWYQYGRAMNAWVRGMSGFAGSLLLVAVAVRAAGSVSGERGKQTLDELLTTPLTNKEIVFAKWAGSIVSVRRGWIWLGIVFLMGTISGGLNPLGAGVTIIAWLAYASMFAAIGLWYSIHARNTFRATAYTLMSVLFLLGLHWLVHLFCCALPVWGVGGREPDLLRWIAYAQLGVTPPVSLAILPISGFDELYGMDEDLAGIIIFQFIGIGLYIAIALVFLAALPQRFGIQFSRTDHRQPDNPNRLFEKELPKTDEQPVQSASVPPMNPNGI